MLRFITRKAIPLIAIMSFLVSQSHAEEPKPLSLPEAIPTPLPPMIPPGVPSAPEVIPLDAAPPLAPTEAALEGCDGKCDGFNFKKIPPVRVLPPAGYYPILPTKPGYYSLLDEIEGNFREKPPKYGYPRFALISPSFFDADFRYLDDPKNKDHDFFDPIKRIHLGSNWLLSLGGQTSTRYMHETNSRLTRKENDYTLFRTRAYADLWYQDMFRIYGEFIGADSIGYELNPLVIDRNRADILNLFADVKIGEVQNAPVYARIGRQELLLGSQRNISALDWANTRRTFQGARIMSTSEKVDYDLFWVQPVIPNARRLDSVDNNQNFFGSWLTYRPRKGDFLDLYWLFLDNTNVTRQQNINVAPTSVHTIGGRSTGNRDGFLWEVEANVQLGERGNEHIYAGSTSTGVGYNWAENPLNPTFWLYYDYASGDRNPNQGNYNTYNQLFPFGHYYLGWVDLVGRQNIQDLNAHLYLYPTNYTTVWLQYHHFRLDQSRDALYNAGGAAIRRDATGRAGRNLGDEIDIVLNFHLSKHADILTGYSRLFGGDFLRNTSGKNASINSDLFYFMYSYKF